MLIQSRAQWSKLGRPVHLIDKSEQQLQRAQSYIQELRESSSVGSQGWGPVKSFNADRIDEAVSSSWLVVEVIDIPSYSRA